MVTPNQQGFLTDLSFLFSKGLVGHSVFRTEDEVFALIFDGILVRKLDVCNLDGIQ